jgi:hypothetical protein
MRKIRSMGRALSAVAAALVLGAASRDSVPAYYSHAEYYSSSSYTNQVGGWLSCPPEMGGYSSWGTRTSYAIYTSNDYAACNIEW